jgi:hypothetical protein
MPEWITKYWVEWIFGILAAGLLALVRSLSGKVKRQQEENAALRDGVRSLLRAQIMSECERSLKDGWCGPRLRDTIGDLYKSYHALGGNGTVTDIVEQTRRLPAMQPERGEHHD